MNEKFLFEKERIFTTFVCRIYVDDYNDDNIIFEVDNWNSLSELNCKEVEKLCMRLNKLYEDNEQLKQRNNRQAKQLDKLYTLIEKEDWQALKGIIQDFQKCEEQLQRESKYYEKGLSND